MSLTTSQRAETLLQDSSEVLAVLITIDHTDLTSPIRLVNAAISVIQSDPAIHGAVSNSEIFYYVPFDLRPSEESERPGGRAELTIPHFSPDLVLDFASTFRSLTGRAGVTADVVMTPDIDNPVLSFSAWEVVTSRVDAESITLELRADGLTFEPAPTGSYDRRQFPGLFS